MSAQEMIGFVRLNAWLEGNEFVDSLLAEEVDTIIAYQAACVDCQPNSANPYYIFWKQDQDWYLQKFQTQGRFRLLKGFEAPVGYIDQHWSALTEDDIIRPNFIRSAYGFERVQVLLSKRQLDYRIKDYEKEINEKSIHLLLINHLRETVMAIPQEQWVNISKG